MDFGAERMAIVMLLLGPRSDSWEEAVETAKRYYKQYAEEVVAHLPDNWSMSASDVLAWIEKKEKRRRKKK